MNRESNKRDLIRERRIMLATATRRRMALARLTRETNPDRWLTSTMPDFGNGRTVLFFNPGRNRTVTLRIAF